MYSFVTIDFICLNSSTINMLLNFLKANYIMIDIFAYLKLHMETMSFHTVPTEPETAVNAKDILLIFAEVVMNTTGTEEFAMQKGIKPICYLCVFRKFTAYHSSIHLRTGFAGIAVVDTISEKKIKNLQKSPEGL